MNKYVERGLLLFLDWKHLGLESLCDDYPENQVVLMGSVVM